MCGERSYYIGADPDNQQCLIWVCYCGVVSDRNFKTVRSARAALHEHQNDPQRNKDNGRS